MVLDPTSSKFKQPTNYSNGKDSHRQLFKPLAGSDLFTGPKYKKVNNMIPEFHWGEEQAGHYGDIVQSVHKADDTT